MDFVLLLLSFSLGFFANRKRIFAPESAKVVNFFILYLALPAVTLQYVPYIQWNNNVILPFAMPVLVWIGAGLTAFLIQQLFKVSNATFAAIWITIGLGNTSFIGFPLSTYYYGESGLKIAVLCDQMSFIILSTFALAVASYYSKHNDFSIHNVIKKVLTFPSFILFTICILFPSQIKALPLDKIINPLATSLIPLAFFSIGLQLKLGDLTRLNPKIAGITLGYKLFLAPLVIFLLGRMFTEGLSLQVSVLEAAVAPMVTGVIIANDHELDPKLSNALLGLGIIISFFSTYIWVQVVR